MALMASAALHPSYNFLKSPLAPLFQRGERDGVVTGLEVLPERLALNAKNYGYVLATIDNFAQFASASAT